MREDDVQNGSRSPGVPAWLKISGVIVAVLLIVVVVVFIVVGGEHGPGRHGAIGAATLDAPTSAGALG